MSSINGQISELKPIDQFVSTFQIFVNIAVKVDVFFVFKLNFKLVTID